MSRARRWASYADAVEWVALNDDNEWLNDDNGSPSVCASLVSDIFNRSREQVSRDIRKVIEQERGATTP